MAKVQTRRSVSLSRELFDLVAAEALRQRRPVAAVVADVLASRLRSGPPIVTPLPPPPPAPAPAQRRRRRRRPGRPAKLAGAKPDQVIIDDPHIKSPAELERELEARVGMIYPQGRPPDPPLPPSHCQMCDIELPEEATIRGDGLCERCSAPAEVPAYQVVYDED